MSDRANVSTWVREQVAALHPDHCDGCNMRRPRGYRSDGWFVRLTDGRIELACPKCREALWLTGTAATHLLPGDATD